MCPGIYKKSFPIAISRMHNQPLCISSDQGEGTFWPRIIWEHYPVVRGCSQSTNDVYFIQLEEYYYQIMP